MATRLKIALISLLLMGWGVAVGQVKFGIELLSDQSTYLVSLRSDTTIASAISITGSVQITIRVPHGEAPNNFTVGNITNLQPNTSWQDNVHIYAPTEAPNWDYISFALLSLGTSSLSYNQGVTIPLFSFTNEAASCVGNIELIDTENDPFLPPNSYNANIGHSIVVFGMGYGNAYRGNTGTGTALCVPEAPCDEVPVYQNLSLCQGTVFDGYYFDQDTVLVRHFFSENACDSMVTTYLNVLESYDYQIDTAICLGELYQGQFYFSNTSFIENLQTVDGCDSIVWTNLEIRQPSITNQDTTVCFGTVFANTVIENDTLLFQYFIGENGCDSIINTQVFVTPLTTIIKDTLICAGTAIDGIVFTQDTIIEEFFTGYNGCDSLFTQLSVQVIADMTTTANVLLIEGSSYQNFTPSGDTTIVQNLIGQTGCDSIATTHIFVFPSNTTIIDTTICQGQILLGQSIETDTILTDTLQLTSTTDSIIVTNVQVLPSTINQISKILCYGEYFNGIPYYSDTILTEIFNGSTGCDSITLTQLQIVGSAPVFQEFQLCAGDLFLGQTFLADTILIKTFTGTEGCDSIVQTALTVHPLPEPVITGQSTFCNGETVALTTQNFDNYLWSNNTVQSGINIQTPGNYSVTVTDTNGCTGSAVFEASVIDISAQAASTPPSCDGLNDDGSIRFLDISGGLAPYVFSINGGNSFETQPFFENLSSGDYQLIVEDANGCQWQGNSFIDDIDALDFKISIVADKENIDLGDSVRLQVLTNFENYDSIIWHPASSLNCSNCLTPIAKPVETTVYHVKVMANGGCSAEESIAIRVSKPQKIYVPNVFSPNNDGENDRLFPLAASDVEAIRSFRVFDRFGGMVFEQMNFAPNDPQLGWDGRRQGKPLNSGVFVWQMEVEFIDGNVEIMHGSTTIIK